MIKLPKALLLAKLSTDKSVGDTLWWYISFQKKKKNHGISLNIEYDKNYNLPRRVYARK